MKIIDKNYDYYDYLQTPDDKIVFDRRNSFVLTKEKVIDNIDYVRYNRDSKYRFILLQCGATYWLFLLTIIDYKEDIWGCNRISDYSLELITSWKNYNKFRKIIDICFISFHNSHIFYNHNLKDFSIDKIKSRVNDLKNSIDVNDYNSERDLSHSSSYTDYKGKWKEIKKDIPLLKTCGISQLVDPTEIFYAIEEHFSLEKTESERTEAAGTTNNDKIAMHGFDTKTSFRGKN